MASIVRNPLVSTCCMLSTIGDDVIPASDGDGRREDVYVRPHTFDISELKSGDEIVVDFVMPHGRSSRLEAAHLWIR